MKITKSELKEMIRECLREELSLREAAVSGGQAEGGFLDTAKRPGGSTSKNKFDALSGKKTKKVLAKDLKPGMVTDTGEVKQVTDRGNTIEVSYGGVGNRGSYASDNVAKDHEYDVLDESIEEELENIFEGIFDSKEKKQQAYAKLIQDTFKKAPAAVAAGLASSAVDALQDTINCIDDDNVSLATAGAKNLISAINSAKSHKDKNDYGLINSIIDYVKKWNRDAVALDDLIEFKQNLRQLQGNGKEGTKAGTYLMELVNKQLLARMDATVAFLKKEFSI